MRQVPEEVIYIFAESCSREGIYAPGAESCTGLPKLWLHRPLVGLGGQIELFCLLSQGKWVMLTSCQRKEAIPICVSGGESVVDMPKLWLDRTHGRGGGVILILRHVQRENELCLHMPQAEEAVLKYIPQGEGAVLKKPKIIMRQAPCGRVIQWYTISQRKPGADPESLESESQDPNSGKRGPENDIWLFFSVFFLWIFCKILQKRGAAGPCSPFPKSARGNSVYTCPREEGAVLKQGRELQPILLYTP